MMQVQQSRRGCETISKLHLNWKRKVTCVCPYYSEGEKKNIINVAHPKQLHFIIPGFIFAAKEGFMLID